MLKAQNPLNIWFYCRKENSAIQRNLDRSEEEQLWLTSLNINAFFFSSTSKRIESDCGPRGQIFINPFRKLSLGLSLVGTWAVRCRGKCGGISNLDLSLDSATNLLCDFS